MDSQAYIIKITVDYNIHPCRHGAVVEPIHGWGITSMLHWRMYATDSNSNAVCWDFENKLWQKILDQRVKWGFWSALKSAFYPCLHPQIRTSAHPHFTPGRYIHLLTSGHAVGVINIAADHQMFISLTGERSWQLLRRSAVCLLYTSDAADE